MNIDKFKHQHVQILDSIKTLRELVKNGIKLNAQKIASTVISMSSTIKLHLSVEEQALYPSLKNTGDTQLISMGQQYQSEMAEIISVYMKFARKWNTATNIANDPEGFRSDANIVLKVLFERIKKENTYFYPAIEAH